VSRPLRDHFERLARALRLSPPESLRRRVPIRPLDARVTTAVDAYWGGHTVNSKPFTSAEESIRYLEWRANEYPLFREFMRLDDPHDNECILDYGCGPGDDVVWFLLHSQARKIVGIDVSEKALRLASDRLALHGIDPARVELVRSGDSLTRLPLESESIDYVHCGGVLHHTSDPVALLREFHRVLPPTGRAYIMVYKRDSLWFHLYTAYIRMILQGDFTGLSVEAAFARNTDGEACPIARCYRPEEFAAMAEMAGLVAEFVGGYLSRHELACWTQHGPAALTDGRLGSEHRTFLAALAWDERAYPMYEGKHAGIGGVYHLVKR
jgi:ubiquinone/menaquinone biosynthesis C-methylase UbiE